MPSAIPKRLTSGMYHQPSRTYSPTILPMMQSLLRVLGDIDFEYQKDRETILKSAIEETLKRRAIATLAKRHHERRAPYLREIHRLERQVQRMFA